MEAQRGRSAAAAALMVLVVWAGLLVGEAQGDAEFIATWRRIQREREEAEVNNAAAALRSTQQGTGAYCGFVDRQGAAVDAALGDAKQGEYRCFSEACFNAIDGFQYPETETDCEFAATQLGLSLGGGGFAFAGASYATKGCYTHTSGTYLGMAFFGSGGSSADMLATPAAPETRLACGDPCTTGLNVPNSDYASGVANLVGVTGDTATVACVTGYSGAGTYTCGSDGAFTGAPCAGDPCTTGLNVPNSDYASGVANLAGVTGDTVTVACDDILPGYSGTRTYTCGSDGAFTGAACAGSHDYDGYRYATMEGDSPSSRSVGCQSSYVTMPTGWELVPRAMISDTFLSQVITQGNDGKNWATNCIVLADGSSWATNFGHSCGNGLTLETSGNSYRVTGCYRRVFMRRAL